MILFLDTEFNGFGGQLLSMALVTLDYYNPNFYKEIEVKEPLDNWVKENVMPHMMLEPCNELDFKYELANYINRIGDCTIIADWPDDIRYFCQSLITGPGQIVPIRSKITFELNLNINYKSKVPHNALYDAEGIKQWYLNKEK